MTSSPTPEELVRMVTGHPLLSTIDRSLLVGLKNELEWMPLDENQVLFHEGDAVDGFYFVIDGLLEVTTMQEDLDGEPNDPLVLGEIKRGETIGETQILIGGNRSVTATAKQKSGLIKFSKAAFDEFLKADREVVRKLEHTIMPRLYRDIMVDILPNLFGELDEEMLQDVEEKKEWIHLKRGEVLYRQGEDSDSFFVIISGRLQTRIGNKPSRQKIVGVMSQGECVGEMGVFTGEPRSATVVASRDCELLKFSKNEFDELTEKYPALMRHMTKLLITRLQQAYRETPIANLSSNIMLAPASKVVQMDVFADRLAKLLNLMNPSGTDSCLLLKSHVVDELMQMPGISQEADEGEPDDLRLRSWLNEQEKRYRIILYQSDLSPTNWTRRCCRQADQILSVGSIDGDPKLNEVEREILADQGIIDEDRADVADAVGTTLGSAERDALEKQGTIKRWSLILLHPDGAQRPKGTLAWLHARRRIFKRKDAQGHDESTIVELDRHLHVRMDREDDYERVARFVAGREVGLVLSGGGARGFAHVGIIKAMQEKKIPIDIIAGVSMGSLVGAAYAYCGGEDFAKMAEKTKGQLEGAFFDFTIPLVSISRGRRFDRRLKFLFDDVNIEDLWVPYFCVSSNLTQADIAVLKTGPLWRNVRASGTLPGVIPPVIHEVPRRGKPLKEGEDNLQGELLYDGCLLDNLPMDVMREEVDNGIVIAVDVVPPEDLPVDATKIESPSGWRLLINRLNPFAKKRIDLPSIIAIIHRAGELGSVYGRQRLIDSQVWDEYIEPQVGEFSITDFAAVDKTAAIGYTCGEKHLELKWKRQVDADGLERLRFTDRAGLPHVIRVLPKKAAAVHGERKV
jgi:NTE family protein/lysophospholipid hydrolase